MGIGVIGGNLLGTWEEFGYCVDGGRVCGFVLT